MPLWTPSIEISTCSGVRESKITNPKYLSPQLGASTETEPPRLVWTADRSRYSVNVSSKNPSSIISLASIFKVDGESSCSAINFAPQVVCNSVKVSIEFRLPYGRFPNIKVTAGLFGCTHTFQLNLVCEMAFSETAITDFFKWWLVCFTYLFCEWASGMKITSTWWISGICYFT